MADPSFDVVSKVDRQEVDNALNQAAKEAATRYDFKGTGAEIAWSGDSIVIKANAEERCAALLGVALDLDLLAGPRDGRPGVLEVVALRDLLGGLVQGVVDLLMVDLAHDVERRVGHARLLAIVSRALLAGCVPGRVARVVKGSRL